MILVIAGRNLMSHLSARWHVGTYWEGSRADGALPPPHALTLPPLNFYTNVLPETPPSTPEFISFIPRHHKTHRRALRF